MKERRLGKFKVADRLLHDAINTGHGQNLFAGAVPLDIQRDWASGTTTYIAWHKDFPPISEGEIIPEYRAIFHAGSVLPTWQRVEEKQW